MDDTHKRMEETQIDPEFNNPQDKACFEQGADRDPDLTRETGSEQLEPSKRISQR